MISQDEVVRVLSDGDPERVASLIRAGADIRYKREHGYDALIDAVHGRDVGRDPRLLDLLRLLIANGVDLNGTSAYKESGLRVLSCIGRFDGVRLLLEAGADKAHLEWTPLMEAVCLGSLADVEARLSAGALLEARDWWSRTAFLLSLVVGDIAKAELLLASGANPNVSGRCGQPPLMMAVNGLHPHVLHWLLDRQVDTEQSDEFGETPLMEAAELDDLQCVEILLLAGANVDADANGTALSRACSREVALRLLDAGSDPQTVSAEGRRALLGLSPEPDEALLTVSAEDFIRAPTTRFGTANPEPMNEPFWQAMIRAGLTAYCARTKFSMSYSSLEPVWCAQRFGQTLTFLPDGRIVQIGGEHEDYYDQDFCIYNDVFVHGPNGSVQVYGYSENVFEPTDFHTATLIGNHIYIIGSLGYAESRRYDETPLYRLDIRTLRMERLAASGQHVGRIYKHRARAASDSEIRVWGGEVLLLRDGKEVSRENADTFVLDVGNLRWHRE
ncbi:MAG TPA: ankyrin repeat domain-containing protein [Armatimonadota bacterium]|nr:ankyrin repeat domain-containing protein [Armatimonadota bacterium]